MYVHMQLMYVHMQLMYAHMQLMYVHMQFFLKLNLGHRLNAATRKNEDKEMF